MDISSKLKLFFWILVLGLWGVFTYGFIKKGKLTKITEIENPFKSITLTEVTEEPEAPAEIPPEVSLIIPAAETTAEHIKVEALAEHHSLNERKYTAEKLTAKPKPKWKPAPDGYDIKDIKSFLIYKEIPPIIQKFISALLSLRGNLMLDLIIFTPWTRENKVLVYLFDYKKTYHLFTNRPLWSEGTSDLLNRTVYIINTINALGILAHELTHIYFDGFFNKSKPSPLWLSEGMAVFIQSEKGRQPPGWLKENLYYIKNGDGFKLKDLMNFENLNSLRTKDIQLWYAQCYSVVRFLIKLQSMDNFYQFCRNLRDGKNVSGSLYSSYGMPYTTVSALESAWRYNTKTNRILSVWE